MKNIKIEIPEGYEIDETNSTFTNIVFKEKEKETDYVQLMSDMWRGCNVVKYSSDGCRTYCKNDISMFQQDWNNKKLYYSYYNVYKIFDGKLSEKEINQLVIDVLSKDINCTEIKEASFFYFLWSRNLPNK